MTVQGSSLIRSSSCIGRGVVVTSARGRRPSPKPELQIVPRRFRLAPFRQLVAPGEIMFRPAQPIGIVAGKELRLASVRPSSAGRGSAPNSSCLPMQSATREQAADPFDHDAPRVRDRRSDQGDPHARPRSSPAP